MPTDPRQIVAQGYDAAAEEYPRWIAAHVVDTARARYQESFSALLAQGSSVLELGCGGGGPTTEYFAQRFVLTGIDVSERQVALARERVPMATFVQADMTRFASASSSFDGVAAFYSLIHLPYGELPAMLARISTWLREGGVLVASFGARGHSGGEHVEADWLGGAPMYWSGYPLEDYIRFLEEAGLSVIEANVETNIEDGQAAPFFWVLAKKSPASD